MDKKQLLQFSKLHDKLLQENNNLLKTLSELQEEISKNNEILEFFSKKFSSICRKCGDKKSSSQVFYCNKCEHLMCFCGNDYPEKNKCVFALMKDESENETLVKYCCSECPEINKDRDEGMLLDEVFILLENKNEIKESQEQK